MSAGSGILIAFFCTCSVYIIGGMLYNYRLGATGIEMLPHLSFWRSLPGYIKDGFAFSFGECFGLRSAGGRYAPVNAAPSVRYGAL